MIDIITHTWSLVNALDVYYSRFNDERKCEQKIKR